MPYYLNMALSSHLQCELGRPLRQVSGSDFLRIDRQWEPHPSVLAHFTLGLDNACDILIAVSVPGIVGGVGLLRSKSWARYVILVLSILDLLNIPIGTALGIYGIWVLVNDETVRLLDSRPGQ